MKNNAKYIKDFFNPMFIEIEEKLKDINFEYFILENNSTDNTKKELEKFSKNKNCKLFIKNFKINKNYNKEVALERGIYMAKLRNTLKLYHGELDSDYTILIDTDIIFNYKTIINMIDVIKNNSNIKMLCPYLMCSKRLKRGICHYYDSFAFISDKY